MINWFKKIGRKFSNALRGFYIILKEEKSLWVHFIVTLIVVIFGIIFSLSEWEWVSLILFIALVIGFEILNTGLEYLADLVSFEYNVNVRKIKDLGAAATLFASILAIIGGLVIFIPHFITLFSM